jgi:hypothetical protein
MEKAKIKGVRRLAKMAATIIVKEMIDCAIIEVLVCCSMPGGIKCCFLA